jgi:hypothetical protein
MKLNYLLLLLFPVFSFGQIPRITFLESDSILVQSQWYALLEEDIQALNSFVKDSILEVEMEKHTLRYEELVEEFQHYCGHNRSYEMEIEQELKDRQENLKYLAKTADEFLSAYEDSLLVLWKEELLLVVDSLAVVWKYDFVLSKQAMVFLTIDNTKEQALFEQAIIKVLNQKPSIKKWEPKIELLQKECLKSIRAGIYVHPVDVQKELSKLDVFRKVALWMHGARLT